MGAVSARKTCGLMRTPVADLSKRASSSSEKPLSGPVMKRVDFVTGSGREAARRSPKKMFDSVANKELRSLTISMEGRCSLLDCLRAEIVRFLSRSI